MSSCYDGSFPCQNPDYAVFDDVATRELRNPPAAHAIVNDSRFCTPIPIDEACQLSDLDHKDYLALLRGKTGLYHLWIDYEHCTDHDTRTMLCVYVGKGLAEVRISAHIRDKWPRAEQLYVTFYECSNRMAKYLEQLFLDTYAFHLNTNENPGDADLFAVWDGERHLLGTVLNEVSARSKLDGFEGEFES